MILSPENEAALAKLQAIDEATSKAELEAVAAASKLFDPAEIHGRTSIIYTLSDEKLGTIKYGKLSQKEFDVAGKETDINKRVSKRIFMMLQKGYPDLTESQFEEWPAEVVMRITDILAEMQNSFLRRAPAILKAGLKTTP